MCILLSLHKHLLALFFKLKYLTLLLLYVFDHLLILLVHKLILSPQVRYFLELILYLMAKHILRCILWDNQLMLQWSNLTLEILYDIDHFFVLMPLCLALLVAHSYLIFETLDQIFHLPLLKFCLTGTSVFLSSLVSQMALLELVAKVLNLRALVNNRQF